MRRSLFGLRAADVDMALIASEGQRNALQDEFDSVSAELELLKRDVAEREALEVELRAEFVRARQTLEEERRALEEERRMVIEAAQEHGEDVFRRAQRRVSEEGWELHRAKIERQRFLEAFRSLLLRYMEEIDRLAAESAPSAVVEPKGRGESGDRPFVPPGFTAPA